MSGYFDISTTMVSDEVEWVGEEAGQGFFRWIIDRGSLSRETLTALAR